MTSASDKEARAFPFILAEDRERKLFAVGTARDNKMPRVYLGVSTSNVRCSLESLSPLVENYD